MKVWLHVLRLARKGKVRARSVNSTGCGNGAATRPLVW